MELDLLVTTSVWGLSQDTAVVTRSDQDIIMVQLHCCHCQLGPQLTLISPRCLVTSDTSNNEVNSQNKLPALWRRRQGGETKTFTLLFYRHKTNNVLEGTCLNRKINKQKGLAHAFKVKINLLDQLGKNMYLKKSRVKYVDGGKILVERKIDVILVAS